MTRRSVTARWIAVPVALVVVGLVVLLATSDKHVESAKSPLVGKVAPSLVGETLDGTRFDLSAHRGSFVVVNFFASWCQPCQAEAPELQEWAKRHENDDAILVNVLFQDTPEGARAFFDRYGGGDWPVITTDTDTIGLDWGVAKVPETYVIAPNGVVVVKTISTVTAAELDGYLARFGSQEDPNGPG